MNQTTDTATADQVEDYVHGYPPEEHPFYCRHSDGQPFFYCGVDDRLRVVKGADLSTIKKIIALPDDAFLQKTVLKAAERRLAKLLKEEGIAATATPPTPEEAPAEVDPPSHVGRVLGSEIRILSSPLTPEEIRAKAMGMADLLNNIDDLEAKKKADALRIGNQIKELEERLKKIGEEVHNGFIERSVPCKWIAREDYAALVRTDTGAEIGTRALDLYDVADPPAEDTSAPEERIAITAQFFMVRRNHEDKNSTPLIAIDQLDAATWDGGSDGVEEVTDKAELQEEFGVSLSTCPALSDEVAKQIPRDHDCHQWTCEQWLEWMRLTTPATLTESIDTVARCRKCSCTDTDCSKCVERTGEPCHWVDDDLCSACAVHNLGLWHLSNREHGWERVVLAHSRRNVMEYARASFPQGDAVQRIEDAAHLDRLGIPPRRQPVAAPGVEISDMEELWTCSDWLEAWTPQPPKEEPVYRYQCRAAKSRGPWQDTTEEKVRAVYAVGRYDDPEWVDDRLAVLRRREGEAVVHGKLAFRAVLVTTSLVEEVGADA